MSVRRQKPMSYIFHLVLGVACIVVSLVLMAGLLDNYRVLTTDYQDTQLFNISSTIRRNVDTLLESESNMLTYTAADDRVIAAARQLGESGDSAPLLGELSKSVLMSGDLVQTVIVKHGDTAVASVDGHDDYTVESEPRPFADGLTAAIIRGKDGEYYLGLTANAADSFTYTALIDLLSFYQKVDVDFSNTASGGYSGRLMLLDSSGTVILHQTVDGARVDSVGALLRRGSGCDLDGLHIMIDSQANGVNGSKFYSAVDCASGESYRAHIAVSPALGGSDLFTIGAVINYDRLIAPYYDKAMNFMIYLGVMLLGVSILFVRLLVVRREGVSAIREKEELMEKNRVMEELNRRTQKLAHHQRLQTIGVMTSSIAHEFNNLLTPIMGYSIMTLERLQPEDHELYDNVLEIYNASMKAKTIITRLSYLSRSSAPQTFKDVDVDELIKKLADVTRPLLPPGVELSVVSSCSCAVVNGNELLLYQMLLNLCVNSFHATEEAGGKVKVETACEGTHLRITVSDSGSGISPEALPHIFEPFFSTKDASKGTGLGLAIVEEVVKHHGGTITVESCVGSGTVVTVLLPLVNEGCTKNSDGDCRSTDTAPKGDVSAEL
ncbi:MAG: ATP-binding protein [Oscillospiraceae bacterium]